MSVDSWHLQLKITPQLMLRGRGWGTKVMTRHKECGCIMRDQNSAAETTNDRSYVNVHVQLTA